MLLVRVWSWPLCIISLFFEDSYSLQQTASSGLLALFYSSTNSFLSLLQGPLNRCSMLHVHLTGACWWSQRSAMSACSSWALSFKSKAANMM